jgi:hypothetical protein
MDEARLGADDFGQMGREGDDVVLGASISNQILKRVWGSQMEAISGRV